jgi:hypothetical protein
MRMNSLNRCVSLQFSILFLATLGSLPEVYSIATYNKQTTQPQRSTVPCINYQYLKPSNCGSGDLNWNSFAKDSSLIIAPSLASKVTLTFTEFNTSSTIEVYSCVDESCLHSTRLSIFTLSVKTAPVLRDVTSSTGVMKIVKRDPRGSQAGGSFQARWAGTGVRLYTFRISDERRVSQFAPFDREYHCVIFDGDAPVYTLGTYGSSAYFEGPADRDGTGRTLVAWYESSLTSGVSTGGAELRYAPDYTSVEGAVGGTGSSGPYGGLGSWAAVDGYQVVATDDDVQRHCLLTRAAGATYERSLGIEAGAMPDAPSLRANLPPLAESLFRTPGAAFGTALRFCPAGDASLAGAYSHAYGWADPEENLTIGDTEYGVLGADADAFPFASAAGLGVVGTWAASPGLGQQGRGTFLYILRAAPPGAARLVGGFCRSDAAGGGRQCYDDQLDYVERSGCCPQWNSKNLSAAPARGRDALRVQGTGFTRLSRDAEFRCQFGSGDNALLSDPEDTDAASDSVLVCRTPPWPAAAGRVKFSVVAARGLAPVPFAGGDPAETGFNYTECVLGAAETPLVRFGPYGGAVVVSEGPAAGGTDLLLIGHGLDPASSAPYRCSFAGAGNACAGAAVANASARCAVEGAVTLVTGTTLFCQTPAWGAAHADSWAPSARAAGGAPSTRTAAVVLHGDSEVPFCPPPNVAAPGGAAPACPDGRCEAAAGYPFAFFAVWSLAGGAADPGATVLGGDAVAVAGFGFDPRARFVCRFWNPAWKVPLLSQPVAANNTTSLTCTAPASSFPANVSRLSLHMLPPNASSLQDVGEASLIPLTSGGWSQYAFRPVLEAAYPSTGLAVGGTSVTLVGKGFAPGVACECIFSGMAMRAAVAAAALNDTLVYCVAPPWPGPGVVVTLTVECEGLAASVPFLYAATWNNSLALADGLYGPSSGGDKLRFFGAGFDPSAQYRCYFVGLSGEKSEPATVLGVGGVSCTTPSWGASFPAQKVAVVIKQATVGVFAAIPVTHPANRVLGQSGAGYTFTPSAACNTSTCGSSCATGGMEIIVSGFGLDSAANYTCQFRSPSNHLPVVTAATVSSTMALVCPVPPWPYQAENASVYVIHQDDRPFLSLQAAAGVFSYYTCWVGKSVSQGPSKGGGIVTVAGAGFLLSDARYTCEFSNNASSASSDAAATSSASIACPIPPWPFSSGTLTFGLALFGLPVPYEGAGETDRHFAFTDGWLHLVNTSRGSAAGGSTVSVSAYGLILSANYRCVFTSPQDVSKSKVAKATVLSPSFLVCTSPDWGSTYSEGVVSLGIQREEYFLLRFGSNSADGALGQQSYAFYQAWNSSASQPRFITAGGSSVTVQGSGFSHLMRYCCKLDIDATGWSGERKPFSIETFAFANTTSSLVCNFPSFTLGSFVPSSASLSLGVNDCSPGNVIFDESTAPIAMVVIDRGVVGIAPSKGAGNGQTIVTISGFGFDSGLMYRCSFKGAPPASELFTPVSVISLSEVTCNIPVLETEATNVDFSIQVQIPQRGRSVRFETIQSYNVSCIYINSHISGPDGCNTSVSFDFLPIISHIAPSYVDRLGRTVAGNQQLVTVMGRGFDSSASYECRYTVDPSYAIQVARLYLLSNAVYKSRSNCQCPGGCGTLTYGSFSTGNPLGQNYNDNALCFWILAPPKAPAVSMIFLFFDTELNYDFVALYTCFDIACNNRSLLSRWSGQGPPEGSVFTSATGVMMVQFESDALTGGLGFLSAFWGLNYAPLEANSAPLLSTTSLNATVIDSKSMVCDFPVWEDGALWGKPFIDAANVTVVQLFGSPNAVSVIQIERYDAMLLEIVEINRSPVFQGSSISVPMCYGECIYSLKNWSTNIFSGADALEDHVKTERNQRLTFSVIISTAFGQNLFVGNMPRLIFDASTGFTAALEFQIRPHVTGFASFTVQLRDDGSQMYQGSNLAQKTFSIAVLPPLVNLTGAGKKSVIPLQVLENSGKQTIAGLVQKIVGINFVNEMLHVSPEMLLFKIGQVHLNISLSISTEDAAYFEQSPILKWAPGNATLFLTDCLLEFKTAAFAFGKSNISLALKVTQDAANSDSALNINDVPGIDIESRIFLIELDILPVNQPPTFTIINKKIVANYGSSPFVDQLMISSILPGSNTSNLVGPRGEDWAERRQRVTFIVQGLSPIFVQQPTVNQSGFLKFSIKRFRSGSSTFQIWLADDGFGYDALGQIVDGETSRMNDFQIQIEGINDPPFFRTICYSLGLLPDQDILSIPNCSLCGTDSNNCTISITILENCLNCERPGPGECHGHFVQQSFATSISPSVHHSPDEQIQNLSFIFSHVAGNFKLFTPQGAPAIDSTVGSLSFCLAKAVSGSTVYNFSLLDDGGTLRGGSDVFGAFHLEINVLPVNDQPNFEICSRQYFGSCENGSCIDDQCASEVFVWANSSKQELKNFLFNITNGATNASSQDSEPDQLNTITLHFNDSVLFVKNPSLLPNGTLAFELNSSMSTGSASIQILIVDDGLSYDTAAGSLLYCDANGLPYQGVNQSYKTVNFHYIDSYVKVNLSSSVNLDTPTLRSESIRVLALVLQISTARFYVDSVSAEAREVEVKALGYSLEENLMLTSLLLGQNGQIAPFAVRSVQPFLKNLGWEANFSVSRDLLKYFGLSNVTNPSLAIPELVREITAGQDWPVSDQGEELMAFEVAPVQFRATSDPMVFLSRKIMPWVRNGSNGGLLAGPPSITTQCKPRCKGDEVGNLTANLAVVGGFELYGEVQFQVRMNYTSVVRNFTMLIFVVPVNRPPIFRINFTSDAGDVTVSNLSAANAVQQWVSVVVNENCGGCPVIDQLLSPSCGDGHLFSLSNFIENNSTFSMNPDLYALDPYLDGFVDERNQNLSFVFTNLSSEKLFLGQTPTINVNTGSLTFCLRHDAFGEVNYSVYLQDDGNRTNGGMYRSPSFLLRIVVLPVNQAPSFALAPVANVTTYCTDLSNVSPRYCTGQPYLMWSKSGNQSILPFVSQVSRTDLVETDSSESEQTVSFSILYNNQVRRRSSAHAFTFPSYI